MGCEIALLWDIRGLELDLGTLLGVAGDGCT